MYVCLYQQKNSQGTLSPYWEVFEDLKVMIKTIERLASEKVLGPILTFETNSAFVYNRNNTN